MNKHRAVNSSPGVLKSSVAKSGADAPQKGMTRHPSPLGMKTALKTEKFNDFTVRPA